MWFYLVNQLIYMLRLSVTALQDCVMQWYVQWCVQLKERNVNDEMVSLIEMQWHETHQIYYKSLIFRGYYILHFPHER